MNEALHLDPNSEKILGLVCDSELDQLLQRLSVPVSKDIHSGNVNLPTLGITIHMTVGYIEVTAPTTSSSPKKRYGSLKELKAHMKMVFDSKKKFDKFSVFGIGF
jgi:hypothetical protein